MTAIILDYWEGNGDLDESILIKNKITGMLIRLNDMNGGHHLDKNFERNWNEAYAFGRAFYFVYNPWVSGLQNYEWCVTYAPLAANAMAYDVEVAKPDYSPDDYAREVEIFRQMAERRWKTKCYTGFGYTGLLSHWPVTTYWWARYIGYFWYPAVKTPRTWDEVWNAVNNQAFVPYGIYDNRAPGPCDTWQISGDRLLLPGCGEGAIDVSIYNGSTEDWLAWTGKPAYKFFMPWIRK